MTSNFVSGFSRRSRKSLITIAIVMVLLGSPLALVYHALALPTSVLSLKWTRTGLGTNWEGGLVIGDVTGDGIEDVVCAGGTTVWVLNGNSGATIARYTNSRIYRYCQPQLYDVDGDGRLDILVPLYYLPGLAAVKYTGSSTLTQLWVTNLQGSSGSGSVMAKPVAGDIDNDGHLDIFIASQDVSPIGGYDGTISRLDYQGRILYQSFTWRACSGGLSLGDTDNDGTFELYQGDRQEGYADGGYGKGARSFWADNLTERWNRLDFLSSSQAPVLADVNGDGILDVLTGMYREMNILNSTNGKMIQRWSNNAMSVHYGFTVYDIDGDGHLELLCSDGDHDNDPYVDVFDLVTGNLDAELSLAGGDWKWGPLVADISTSHPGMEIICAPNGTTINGWRGVLMIYDSSFNSLQNVTASMSTQLGYPFVQDIDGDTFLELVVCASSGSVYAFNTVENAPAPGYSSALPGSERIRSEVTYFGEARLGVAEHTIMPWKKDYWTAPLVAPVSPGDNALAVPVSTNHLSFKLREHQSNLITYTVTTSPGIGSGSGSNTSNSYAWSTYNLALNKSLEYDKTYTWKVYASDGGKSTVRTYTFRTEQAPIIGNHLPTQNTPSLVSQDGLNTTTSTFKCSNQTTGDLDGNKVTNIYRWQVNGNPVANLLLPFDTRNETMTKDYSGFGNNGVVKGAVWTENGVVGGAYSFDGKDDAIIVSDGGAGYFNDKTSGNNNPELGGDGTWQEITVEAWIYLTENNLGSRIVAKIPSYELGFQSGSTNRLMASVWPAMGKIAQDANNASTDRIQTVSATINNLQLNTWNHIAFTYKNGTGLKLYFNGALVAQNTNVNKGPVKNSLGEPLYIGRLVQPFKGSIDEVRIYRYAQPAEQILNRYQESKDGLSSSSLFYPLGIAALGNTLRCQVIPTDSFEEGGSATSASIALLNSLPIASNLQIYPLRARNLRLDSEDLAASYTYFDADSNVEGASEIRWYRNGILRSGFNNLKQVPSASTSVGDKWNFTVRPKDSLGGFGILQASYTVTIRQNIPPQTNTPQLVSSQLTNFDDEDLIASAQGSTDPDGNPVTNIYRWTSEGASKTNLLMPFDTETPLYLNSNSTAKDYSGYGNDGTVVGAQWVEDGVVGGGYYFDGYDYIRVRENGNSLGGDGTWSEISAEFWVKAPAVTTSAEHVIFKHAPSFSTGGSSGGSYGVGYMVDFRARGTGNQLTWYIYRPNMVNSTTYTLNVGPLDWHHVVCTYKSGVGLRLYMDGLQRSSLVVTGNINATLNGLLDIGGYASGSTDFSGTLDEVRIYPKAMSSAQVFQRFIETKDGLSSSNSIAAQQTTAGDDWVCQVIPNDSWEDGTAKNSANLHVNAVVGNSRPRIDSYSPADLTPQVDEGSSLVFSQVSSDPNGNPLTYKWELDSVQQATTQNWTYSPDDTSAGLRTVKLTVSDGSLTDTQEWYLTVNNVGGPPYTLVVNVVGGGSVTKSPDQANYAEGTVVTLTAAPDLGGSFAGWTGDASGSVSPTTVTMNGNKAVTATFTAPQYTVTVNVVGSGSVAKTPNQATYTYGTVVTLTASPVSGWSFAGWSGDASGSTNPASITVTGDMAVAATFTQDQHSLVVTVVGSGSVTKNPDQATYTYNTVVTLTAQPTSGWSFAGWSGDVSGTTNPNTVTMTSNKIVTATFLPQHNLLIETRGSGSTNPAPGTYAYMEGASVQVEALPASGYKLDYWLLNGTSVGATDPYTVTVSGNRNLTAVFVAAPTSVFEDGFESGSTSAWSSSSITSGETVAVGTDYAHHGIYSAKFTSNGGGGYESARLNRAFSPSLSEIYVRGYFKLTQNGIVDNGDKVKLMELRAGSTIVASAGLWRSSSTLRWWIETRSGTSWVETYTAQVGSLDLTQWFSVELYWKLGATDGEAKLWVNGNQIYQIINADTDNYGSVSTLRFGLAELTNCASTTLYADCAVVATAYIGTEGLFAQYTLNAEVQSLPTLSATPARGSSTPPKTRLRDPNENIRQALSQKTH